MNYVAYIAVVGLLYVTQRWNSHWWWTHGDKLSRDGRERRQSALKHERPESDAIPSGLAPRGCPAATGRVGDGAG